MRKNFIVPFTFHVMIERWIKTCWIICWWCCVWCIIFRSCFVRNSTSLTWTKLCQCYSDWQSRPRLILISNRCSACTHINCKCVFDARAGNKPRFFRKKLFLRFLGFLILLHKEDRTQNYNPGRTSNAPSPLKILEKRVRGHIQDCPNFLSTLRTSNIVRTFLILIGTKAH